MRGIAPAQGQDLDLPRRQQHVRRLRRHHHVEREAVIGSKLNPADQQRFSVFRG
jgi:hypothetical protein